MGSGISTDRRIRVLWLIKGLGPGGAEQLLVSSARVADHGNFDYRIGYLRPDKQHLVPGLREAGAESLLLTAGPGGRFFWPLRLRRLLAGADVMHSHSPVLGAVARVVARTLPRGRRPAVMYTEHNEWGSYRLPTRLVGAFTAGLDDERWAVSAPVRDSMWPAVAARTEVLLHGIVLDDGAGSADRRDAVRRSLGVAGDAVVGLTVANYRREKDYPNLLEAARIALEAAPSLLLLVVGQGPLETEVRGLHESLGLGERVRLLGYRDDVPDLLGAADFFLLGSAHEGLPVAVMEALAAGRPIVATAVGGIPDAVESGVHGLVVPPHDPKSLASAIVQVASDGGLRERMSVAARERSRIFDIRTAVRVEEAAYREFSRARRGG